MQKVQHIYSTGWLNSEKKKIPGHNRLLKIIIISSFL